MQSVVLGDHAKGHFVLGKDGPSFTRYITRYKLQERKPDPRTFRQRFLSYFTCCATWLKADDAESADHVTAEEFCLQTLHALVLALGAVDACLELRTQTDAHAHLVICTAATLLATVQMAGRVTSLRASGHVLLVSYDMLQSADDNEAGRTIRITGPLRT